MRDLAEACFGPALLRVSGLPGGTGVSDGEPLLDAQRREWLARIDAAPGRLHEHLNALSGQRLGLYFERLWHFFLTEDPGTRLLAHNLPVRTETRTIGEFDCLYYCSRRQRNVHLELAVKLYLGCATDDGTRWYGPNTRDRLDLKLDHMLSHQVRLGDHPAAGPVLASLEVDEPLREVVLRGCLFQPWREPLPAPAGYNSARPDAYWIPLTALSAFAGHLAIDTHLPLPRLRWLSRALTCAGDRPLATGALQDALGQRFDAGHGPLLIAALDRAGREHLRYFVVPDEWPGIARDRVID